MVRPLDGQSPKVCTNLRIDPDLKDWAKRSGLNLSKILEKELNKMKTITEALALQIVDDPQAIDRGYLSPETIQDAYQLASAAMEMECFGKLGYLSSIGNPHMWWEENCPKYAELANSSKYRQAKKFGMLLELAEYLVKDDRRELVEARFMALDLLRKHSGLSKEDDQEFVALGQWLGFPAKA